MSLFARDIRAALAASALTFACARGPTNHADLVLRNTLVYTVDSANPRVQAVAVKDGRIVFVGSNDSAEAFVGRATRVLDLAGKMVLPGFVDTHVHPVTGGIELGECDLNAAATLDDIKRIIADCGKRDPNATWLRGGGFQLPLFPNGAPTRQLLDSLVPDRPAFLSSADGHTGWANSRALAIGGVTRATKDPVNGRIERDTQGNPAGTLRETAKRLVSSKMPPYTDAEYFAGLQRGLAMAAQFGITTLNEASAQEPELRAYARADSMGQLTARSVINLLVDPHRGPEQVAELSAWRAKYARGLVRPISTKIFLDGVIEGGTAALLQPYLDRPGYRGELNVAPEQMVSLVHALDSAGFKVHVHAIGDRAIRVAFDAFEAQHRLDGGAGPHHVLAHIQLFDPADVPRFASLGVVASFQPLWAYRDSYIKDLTEPRLGMERSSHQYPIASVVKSGAIVAGGSDWSVSSMNPLEAIQVAITRRGLDDSTGTPWLPAERIDLATALHMYTLGGARAEEQDTLTGTITVGKAADLIVVSDDLFSIPAHRIGKARVLLTLLNGREVFRDSTAIPR
ncbi:MAG: amidohydrolase family protein [Gemmatimonadaceae bacterium]